MSEDAGTRGGLQHGDASQPRRSTRVRAIAQQNALRARLLAQQNHGTDATQAPARHRNTPRNLADDVNGMQLDGGTSSRRGPDVTAHHSDSGETIAEDDICPICQLLLHRPVTTSCNHTLCESCMATWADVSVTTQMQIVDVNEPAVPFHPVSGLEARCPMCRTHTAATLDASRAANLRDKYPTTYAERDAEEDANRVNHEQDEIQTLTLSIGNRHCLVRSDQNSPNKHEWDFFVRPSRTDIIEEVQILLHDTFRQPRIIKHRPPYEVKRLGWGVFTIHAYIILKAGYSWVSEDAEPSPDGAEKGMLGLAWTLDFTEFRGKGSMGRLRLKVKNQRAWEDVNGEEAEDERVRTSLMRQYQRDGAYVPDEEV